MSELSDLNVIVFRARSSLSVDSHTEQDPLATALTARGARVYQLPVQKIEAASADDPLIKIQIEQIESYDKAVFVSRNATFFALRWLDLCQQRLRLTNQCLAVGPTSAALLEQRQIQVAIPQSDWSSEGLLALPEMNNVVGQKILIFRGQGGRRALAEGLTSRGASVNYCELYQRRLDNSHKKELLEVMNSEPPLILIGHNGGVLDAILAVLGTEHSNEVLTQPVIVPGPRLQNYALAMGFQQVIVAASALAEDIEQALVGWYTQKY